MSDLGDFGFWLFLGLVSAAFVAAFFWARTRQRQMRTDVVLKLLESGQSLEPETLDRLLAVPDRARAPGPSRAAADPRTGYRFGNFICFMIGFGTLLFAFLRSGEVYYPLIALGTFPIGLAFVGWTVGDRQFRKGTLPTLKHERDPRDAYLTGGFVFFQIGYGTTFIGLIRSAGVSYPIVALGVFLIGMCFYVWHQGNKEYREGRLTGTPSEL